LLWGLLVLVGRVLLRSRRVISGKTGADIGHGRGLHLVLTVLGLAHCSLRLPRLLLLLLQKLLLDQHLLELLLLLRDRRGGRASRKSRMSVPLPPPSTSTAMPQLRLVPRASALGTRGRHDGRVHVRRAPRAAQRPAGGGMQPRSDGSVAAAGTAAAAPARHPPCWRAHRTATPSAQLFLIKTKKKPHSTDEAVFSSTALTASAQTRGKHCDAETHEHICANCALPG